MPRSLEFRNMLQDETIIPIAQPCIFHQLIELEMKKKKSCCKKWKKAKRCKKCPAHG
jgi:hypothetical protein